MKSGFNWTLTWIIILFVIIPVGGFLFFINNTEVRPFGLANKGELILPIRPVPVLELQQLDGTVVSEDLFRQRWTLITLVKDHCDDICRHNLYLMRQVQIAQGLESEGRLRYLLLVKNLGQMAEFQAIQKEHPRLKIAVIPSAIEEKVLDLLAIQEQREDVVRAQRIYFSDPLGNLMMRYEPNVVGRGLILDLERLLKISQIG